MNLYWATTPCNYENWFVVASSKKEAESFHECAEGFGSGYASAKLVCEIPEELIKKYALKDSDWPAHDLIVDLKGKLITKNNPRRVNFNGVVYQEGTCTEQIYFDDLGHLSGVYIIRIQNTDKYKIGITKDLQRRIKQFKTGNPDNIKIDYFIATENSRKLEKTLHSKFKEHRIGGEWFILDEKRRVELERHIMNLHDTIPDEFLVINLKPVSIEARVY